MAKSTTNHWKLGLFVLASFAALVGTVFWLGARRFDTETYDAYTYFGEAVDGLEIGSPVKFLGVQIGSVREIGIASSKESSLVEVRAEIDLTRMRELGLPLDERGLPIVPETLRTQLVRSWVTGVAFIQTDYYKDNPPIPDYQFQLPTHVVHSVPSSQRTLERGAQEILNRMPELLDSLKGSLSSLDAILDPESAGSLTARAGGVMDRLDGLLDDVEKQKLVATAKQTLATLENAFASIDKFASGLGAEDGAYTSTVVELRTFLQDVREQLHRWDTAGTVASIRNAANELALLTRQTSRTMPQFERTLDALERLAELLEREPGALIHGRSAPSDPLQTGR